MSDGEFLRCSDQGVEFPILGPRGSRAIPDHICQPKKRRAIGMLKMPAVARNPNRTVFAEPGYSGRGSAEKFPGPVVQTSIVRI